MNPQTLTQKIAEIKTIPTNNATRQAKNELAAQLINEIISIYQENLPKQGKIMARYTAEKNLKQTIQTIDTAQPKALTGTLADRYVKINGHEINLRRLGQVLCQIA